MNKQILAFKTFRKQLGLTLVEALAFLAIFGVVAAGAVAMFSSSSNAASSNQISGDVNALKAAIKSQSLAGTAFTAITTTTLDTAGRLSKNMAVSAAACGVAATLPCAKYGDGTAFKITGAANSFNIVLDNLSTEVCENLKINLSNSGYTNTPACAAGSITFTYR